MYPQKAKNAASALVSPHESNTRILLDYIGLSYFIESITTNYQLPFGHLRHP